MHRLNTEDIMEDVADVVAAAVREGDVEESAALSSKIPPPTAAQMIVPPATGGYQPPNQGRQQRLNYYKQFNNWNMCYTCRWEVPNWHTSKTCPCRGPNHKEGFTRETVQQWIAVGY